MVFKPAYLARLGIQKTFTHGYIQSLVAASQSSSASHNTQFSSFSSNVFNYFAKSGPPSNLQNAQHHSSGHGGTAGAKTNPTDVANAHEGGLAAYYAAWHKHQRAEDKEWHQFQFAKRIGWKPPTTIPEPHALSAEVSTPEDFPHGRRSSLAGGERAKSTSALDEVKRQNDNAAVNDASSAVVDDAVTGEASSVHEVNRTAQTQTASSPDVTAVETNAATSVTVPSSPRISGIYSPTESTATLTRSDSEPYTEHLASLAEDQKYGDVLAVFESMLKSGIKPSPSAYNALLLAAINLPKGKHHVVPKALDVYSDMLHRDVAPDTSTYTILIELLAARALDVAVMKDQLNVKQARYGGMDQQGSFMLHSDETESQILAEDDSLSLAIKLFDTAAALSASHLLPGETYRLLISACAGQNRINDMVRIYADMESRNVLPPTDIFAPMIKAFAGAGDLRSSVECYDEYKALAVAHDKGEIDIIRKDEEVYAAVVKAYTDCDRMSGGLRFLGRLEDGVRSTEHMQNIRDTVALHALIPEWLGSLRYDEAITHATERMSGEARQDALASICINAADKNEVAFAPKAFNLLSSTESSTALSAAALAMLAMHVRTGDAGGARAAWQTVKATPPSLDLVEPTTMFAISLIGSGADQEALHEAYNIFTRIRDQESAGYSRAAATERIDEAIDVLGGYILNTSPIPSAAASMAMIRVMIGNGGVNSSLAERFLSSLGPAETSALSWDDINTLTRLQAGLLCGHTHLDIAHSARFTHLLELITSHGASVESSTSKLIEQALIKLERPDLTARWQQFKMSPAPSMISPVSYATVYSPPTPHTSVPYEDTFDPYGASTDFKGSTAIADILEQNHGRHSAHLNEALSRFKNMRRVGRHPRYVTYAKLITAAAKENRLNLAQDVLAMAKQDVPLVTHSRVVTHGWTAILDSMVGACLTVGKRDLAAQFHQELLNMGAAPSANTFGLYITTLKESTKTFDEATEAVKIFQRAKAEGVEPSSFLYNALIGKLGKARRIDDCLLYFAEMRNLGIRPTSVTYGTIVNALCRVSDDKFAEELFEEMESMPNYKPRPAPYNSLMQYFLTTKRDRSKVLAYYDRMTSKKIEPTMHTFKLLIDTHATLEPVNMAAAEQVLADIRHTGAQPEAVHYASLIHAKGCVLHDLEGARATFDSVIAEGRIPPQASLYQAIFESMVANHKVSETAPLLQQMSQQRVSTTPYIANTLIHGWALEKDIKSARAVFDSLGMEKREPSTYEAMTRAYLAVEEHGNAMSIVGEALRRGYPAAVANKICDLVGGGNGGRNALASN